MLVNFQVPGLIHHSPSASGPLEGVLPLPRQDDIATKKRSTGAFLLRLPRATGKASHVRFYRNVKGNRRAFPAGGEGGSRRLTDEARSGAAATTQAFPVVTKERQHGEGFSSFPSRSCKSNTLPTVRCFPLPFLIFNFQFSIFNFPLALCHNLCYNKLILK